MAATGLVAVACSAPAAKAPDVASLSTPSGGAPASSAAPAQPERPRYRLDMTSADMAALQQPYDKCMTEHGVPGRQIRQQGGSMPPADVVDKANKACLAFLPLPIWEQDASNPEAADFQRKVVDCLKKNGVKYVELSTDTSSGVVGPALGGPQNDAESISKGLALEPKCEKEVAGK